MLSARRQIKSKALLDMPYPFSPATISEKSAIVENCANSSDSSVSRFFRTCSSSAITMTSSKNLSTAGRSPAISCSASRYRPSLLCRSARRDVDAACKCNARSASSAKSSVSTAESFQPDSGPAFSRIFRMRLKEIASGSKFFVLRMAFTASARRTASTRSSGPAPAPPHCAHKVISPRGQRRIDFIMGQAATLLQYVPRPFQNKVQHLFLNHYMNTYLWRRVAQRPNRARDCQGKRERQFGFDQDFYDSHCRAPQRERVARPGRDQPHREAAHQRVELVRER